MKVRKNPEDESYKIFTRRRFWFTQAFNIGTGSIAMSTIERLWLALILAFFWGVVFTIAQGIGFFFYDYYMYNRQERKPLPFNEDHPDWSKS